MVDLNHHFDPGDRVRYETVGEDGFPLVRYGFVGGQTNDNGPVVVMLDGELGGDVVDLDEIEPVSISSITLKLEGADLLDEPQLRQGLAKLWHAEAEDAGLQIAAVHPVKDGLGVRDSSEGFALAEVVAAGEQYMLRATSCHNENMILISASRPNRWLF